MRGSWQPVVGCLLALPILLGLAAAPAAAAEPATTTLTKEQTEDRSNFIGQVRKARLGDAEAQWYVGSTYVKLGDPTHALPVLSSAAAAGHPRAATLAGWLHEEGRGTEKNLEEAKSWYRIAAERGEAEAMAALGRLLLQGKGTDTREAARKLFQQAAQLENPDGQYYLGWLLTEHAGGPHDDAQAYAWFLKAARQGHVGAQLAVATHLLTARGVTENRKEAGEWLMRAAKTQDPVAHYLLGRLREGTGATEHDRARSSFRIAAAAGHREAQFALATLLAKSAAETDKKEAVEWFATAAEGGHLAAANRLGELYWKGEGVLPQLDKARALFQRAAVAGEVNAMYNFAGMLSDGLGGPRDTDKALDWYARAADEGHEGASAVVGRLLNSSIKTSSLELKGFWQ
jgi:TPR repeat protein